MSGGGSKDMQREAQRARQEELEREGRIQGGTANIRSKFARAFNDQYYQDFTQAGKDFYTPQLDKQYTDSLQQLKFALARNGLSDSSAKLLRKDKMQTEYETAAGQIGENLKNMVNQRKADVAGQESIATGQLQNSADPASAAAQTAAMIKSQTALPGWSPLGQVFTDSSAFLANQGNLERDNNARYNMGVKNWGGNTNRYLKTIG